VDRRLAGGATRADKKVVQIVEQGANNTMVALSMGRWRHRRMVRLVLEVQSALFKVTPGPIILRNDQGGSFALTKGRMMRAGYVITGPSCDASTWRVGSR
jgi:hypothetical protein